MANTTSIIPFIRANEILFEVDNLKPYKEAHFFFDGVNVDKFIQRASKITTTSFDVSTKFIKQEGLYCSTTRAYAEVITTSSNTIIYINDNYVSLNLDYNGANVSFATDQFKKGDIVFTSNVSINVANISANTFSGRVQYFNSTDKVLVVKPLTGSINTAANTRVLYNLGTNALANINSIVLNSRFGAGNTVISTSNSSNSFVVGSYSHFHGTSSTKNSSPTYLNLATAPPAAVVNTSIYITSGPTLGTQLTINQIIGSNVSNTSTGFTSSVNGTTQYSLGAPTVDDYGRLAGIFQLPETEAFKFKSGQRLFTVVDTLNKDDPDNQMRAVAEYAATGILVNTDQPQAVTPVIPPTPPTPPQPTRFVPEPTFRRGDPVAQTFFTPNDGVGIFVSSVDLYFKNKPLTSRMQPELPVVVKIVTTENGYPTGKVIAESYVKCKDVTTTNGTTTFPSVSNTSTRTKFKFKDPVYLSPNGQYALIVYSDSPVYEVWISELGQTVIGDTNNRRISEQPYAGSFFRSQNASTWTSFQNEDLMFVINRAAFSSTPTTFNFNVVSPKQTIGIDTLTLHSSDVAFKNTSVTYSVRSTVASTGSLDSVYTVVEKNKIYNFSSDLKTSSLNTNRKRMILAGNANSTIVQVQLSTSQNSISPVINSERLSLITEEYIINDGQLSNNNITITSGGGQHSNAANITVTITGPQLYTSDSSANATANVLTAGIVSGNIVAINLKSLGRGYVESPTITITDSTPGVTANATAVIVSEDGKYGGNALARYITKKIVLADGFDAGDLKVYVQAIRPQGTNIVAYYKVLSGSDPDQFDDKKWKKMYLTNNEISPDTSSAVELIFDAYAPNEDEGRLSYVENNVTYPLGGTFKYFSIKLILLASDPSVPPIINNLRAIALPAG